MISKLSLFQVLTISMDESQRERELGMFLIECF